MATDTHHIDTGRNLPVAFVVGLVLLGSIIASLAFNPVFFALLASVAAFAATREMLRMLQSHAVAVPRKWTLLSTMLLVGIGYQYGVTAAGVWLAILVVVGLIIRLLDGVHNFISDASAFVFVLLYIGFTISFSADLAHADNGLQRVLSVVLLTAANDTGGYFAGIASVAIRWCRVSAQKVMGRFCRIDGPADSHRQPGGSVAARHHVVARRTARCHSYVHCDRR